MKGGQESYVTNQLLRKEHVGNMCALHLKLFNKKCKYADCLWPGCDEEAEDSNTILRNMGRCILRLHVWNVRQLFLKLTNLRNPLKSVGTKLQSLHVTSAQTYGDKYWLNNHMKTDHPEPDQDIRAFICTKCGKSLRSPPSLKTHMKYFCHS